MINKENIWCVIPVYNNKDTVKNVAIKCLSILNNVVVVDDGSDDEDISALLSELDVIVLKHKENLGKGKAILTAAKYIEKSGGKHMITIDADGQHNPEDINKFIPLILENEYNFVIGCRNFNTENIPKKSRFGREFANFWLRIEAGIYVNDCQSGFRSYPVRYLNEISFMGKHYDFEAEVLAKAVWSGLELKTVEVDVYYPKPSERVSSFKPILDNFRISLIHTMLVLMRLLPIKHKRLVEKEKPDYKKMLRHPGKFLKNLIIEHASPKELAISASVGTLLAILPLLFVHTIVILYFSMRLNLNKIMALNIQHFFMPPFVPLLCIELGYYMTHGCWLSITSFDAFSSQLSDRLLEWFLGSLILAPLGAILTGIVVYFAARQITKQYINMGL